MLSHSIHLFSACALVASANVLPQALLSGGKPASPIAIGGKPQSSSLVRIACNECAFSTTGINHAGNSASFPEDTFRAQGGSYDILLNFTVSNDATRLELGGTEIYPARNFIASLFRAHPVQISQIPSQQQMHENTLDQVKGVRLRVTSSKLKIAERSAKVGQGGKLVTLHYHIKGIEGRRLGLSPVRLTLAKKPSGVLMLQEIEVQQLRINPTTGHPSFAHHVNTAEQSPKHCDLLPGPLCKLSNMFQWSGDCQRRRKGHGPHFRGSSWERLPGHWRSKHNPGSQDQEYLDRHHHHNHKHQPSSYYHNDLLPAFFRGFVAALIPIMLGIFVGMSISLVGLVVGNIISFVWERLWRTEQAEHVIVSETHEKDEWTKTDLPPRYSDNVDYFLEEKLEI